MLLPFLACEGVKLLTSFALMDDCVSSFQSHGAALGNKMRLKTPSVINNILGESSLELIIDYYYTIIDHPSIDSNFQRKTGI